MKEMIPQITEPVQPQLSGIITQNNIRAVTIMWYYQHKQTLSCTMGKTSCATGYTRVSFQQAPVYKPSVVRIIKDNRCS